MKPLAAVALVSAVSLFGAAIRGAPAQGGPAGATAGEGAPADLRAMDGQVVRIDPAAADRAGLSPRELHWRYAEAELEWGFEDGTGGLGYDGTIESTHLLGVVGKARLLPGDRATTMNGDRAWKSPGSPGSRRGIVVPLLFTDAVRGPGRTIVTVRTTSGSFSFQPIDLRYGPILVSEYGFFIRDVSPRRAEPPPPKPSRTPPPGELMNGKLDAIGGFPAVRGWGYKDTPVVYANPGPEPAAVIPNAVTIPPRAVAVHPGPDRDVAVAWRSPIAGKVSVKGKVVDGHPGGGDGVAWAIVHEGPAGPKVLAEGAINRGGSQSIPAAAQTGSLTGLAVQKGDSLSLVIARRGDYYCDTTLIELVIAESKAEGPGRTWDLAKDVASDIQAGNPHADSLGNAAVWYFVSPPLRGGGQDAGAAPVVFESKAATARQYVEELAARKLKTIRQQVREHPEQTWEAALRAMHGSGPFPAFPQPPYEPRMSVDVPDPNLTALWRIGAWQIIKNCPRIDRADLPRVGRSGDVTGECRRTGDPKDPNGVYVVRDNPFPPLGCETDRVLWALDHMGMHDVARDGMSVWLENQQPDGALYLNSGIETAHRVGALQLPWVMAEHYRLTGDKAWLRKELPRLKAAADWIINRRRTTMKEKLSPEELDGIKAGTWSPYGLQPRIQMGDGDPTGAHYFYTADAFAHRSLKLLADVAGDVDPKLAADLSAEAERYRKDILAVLTESIVLSPVIRTRDGMYHSFLPQGFQDRGPRARALPERVNVFSHCGPYSSDIVASSACVEAWLASGLLSISDPWLDGHFDVLEDVFLLDNPWVRKRTRDYDLDKQWFSNGGFGYQSGWERVPDYYLERDDIPNFLRSWLNRCAVDMNLRNWTFNEHTIFAENDKSHGNSVFLSNFRKMLVMEVGDALWLARGTPRAWLQQGMRIAVENAPTHFGDVDYEIRSDADGGRLAATVKLPSRRAPKAVLLRFRHPTAAPIRSATVNGKEWKDLDAGMEVVKLHDLEGTVTVEARYDR